MKKVLLVGSYSTTDRGRGEGVVAWRLNKDGSLEDTGSAIRLPNPSFLIQTGATVVAVEETKPGSITVLDPRGGLLASEASVPLHQELPCHLATPDNGRHLVVANFSSGSISLLTRCSSVRYRLVDEAHPRPDPQGERGKRPQPHQVVVSRRGTFWVSDRGTDRVYEYAIEDGRLKERARIALPPGTGPRHLAQVRDRLLVVGEQDGRLHLLEVNESDYGGRWIRATPCSRQTHAGADDLHPSHIAVDEKRSRVYVAIRGLHSISVFDLADIQSEGATVPLQEHDSGGRCPRHFVIVDDRLVVANQESDEVSVLSLDPGNGLIGSVIARASSPSPACILPLESSPSSG